MAERWIVEERRETPAALLASWPTAERSPDRRRLAVCRPTAPAVVIGSTQRADSVDRVAAGAAGLEVVRRRSGGGAVLVAPDDPVWVDVWLPADDPLWEADVTEAFTWLGAAWARALGTLGLRDVHVQTGGPGSCTRWSAIVCFGGVGAGEVTVGGRKVVGLSQRRTRTGAWFHGACVLHWDPGPLLGVLALTGTERRAAADGLTGAVTGVADALTGLGLRPDVDRDAVVGALRGVLGA